MYHDDLLGRDVISDKSDDLRETSVVQFGLVPTFRDSCGSAQIFNI